MYGIIFQEMKEFIRLRGGPNAWEQVCKEANISSTFYTSVQVYPDRELFNLATAIANHLHLPVAAMWEEFGIFFMKRFVQSRSYLFHPEWRLLDALEHTDLIFNRVTARQQPAEPEVIFTPVRNSPRQLTLTYQSKRKLCPFIQGIIKGVMEHYGTKATISHPRCMLRGQSDCQFVVNLEIEADASAPASPYSDQRPSPAHPE